MGKSLEFFPWGVPFEKKKITDKGLGIFFLDVPPLPAQIINDRPKAYPQKCPGDHNKSAYISGILYHSIEWHLVQMFLLCM